MPARSRRLAVTGGLAAALVLAAPTTALAAPGGEGSRKDDARGKESREQAEAPREKGSKGASSRPSDPAGNNGTVKVDGQPFDDSRGNEPHVGCTFRLVFWGFDAGERASITFTGQAPTGGGLLHSETGTLVSDDAAGGGQDRDAALVYSVDDELRELLAVTPHPKQGWHVKVAVDVEGAPGGAKQKVLWIDCPTAPAPGTAQPTTAAPAAEPAASPAPASAPPAAAPPATGGGGAAVVPPSVPSASPLAGTTAGVASTDLPPTFGDTSVVLDSTATRQAAATVSARGAVRPSALPFTGVAGIGVLLALGLGALVVGGGLARAGHRRSVAAQL